MVGTERKNFENFASLNRRKWHFQSLLYFSSIMVCESVLSASQDGLLREMFLSKYNLQIFDYIYIYIYEYSISNTSSFEINWGFFGGGGDYSPPPYKTLGWGSCVANLFSRALQQLKSIWSGKCNPLENV